MIRLSLKEENQRLSRTKTAFLHQTITVIENTKSDMFEMMKDFVTKGKHVEENEIVRFLKSILDNFDDKDSHKTTFAFRVIGSGLGTKEDYKLLLGHGIIDSILLSCSSTLSTSQDKINSLGVIRTAHENNLTRLCTEKGLISFLIQQTFDLKENFDIQVHFLLHSITFNLLKCFNESKGSIFAGQLNHLCSLLLSLSSDNNLFPHKTFVKMVEQTVDKFQEEVK